MTQYYEKKAKRIKMPWGGVQKMARKLNIGKVAIGKILDGQKCSKWQFQYSFEEIRKIAIEQYDGQYTE